MKKLLLSGIAALFLAAGTAHADDRLPEHMLGTWCHDYDSTKSQHVYFRPNHYDPDRCCCSDMTDGITIYQHGFDDDSPAVLPGCLFDKIEKKNKDTYLIQTGCQKQGDGPYYPSAAEFQIINGRLFVKWVIARAAPLEPANPQVRWQFDFRRCDVTRNSNSSDDLNLDVHLNDALEIQKLIPKLKKCEKFWQCVNDRDRGKGKHCYINDKRWR